MTGDALARTSVAYGRFLPKALRKRIITGVLVLTDAAAVFAAGSIAALLRFGTLRAPLALPGWSGQVHYLALIVAITLTWPLFFAMERLYNTEMLFWGSGEFRRSVRAVSLGLLATVLVDFALKLPGISREWMGLTWAFAVVLAPAGRAFSRVLIGRLRGRGLLQRPTIIVGANDDAARLANVMHGDPRLGVRIIACLAATHDDLADLPAELEGGVPIIGYAAELVEALEQTGADTLLIVSSEFDHDVISRMIAEVQPLQVDVHISSGLFEVLASRVVVREMNGVPIFVVRGQALTRRKAAVKRAFDVVLSTAIIVLAMPLWALVAAAVKLDSPGPLFFRQERVGLKGRPFRMFKFRSMYQDAEQRLAELRHENEADGPLFKMKDDPRVTRVGRWLRKYSIDEFPQLLNVLIGEMSLVGPRPPLPEETKVYTSRHWKRLDVLPGMTGLWQVSGRSDLSFEEMVRLDLFYIQNWSLAFDFTILLRTLPAVLLGRGAY